MILAASTFVGPSIDWYKMSPAIALAVGALLLILVGSLTPQWRKGAYGIAAATSAGIAAVVTGMLWADLGKNGKASTLIGDALSYDHFSLFATFTIAVVALLVILVTNDYLEREGEDGPEIYALILTAALGGVMMAQANDLIVLFLGLEILSLSFYLLVASNRNRTQSGEAGLKYFILGGFASAFFLYGVALVFGSTGSTNITNIATSIATEHGRGGDSALLLAGIAMLLVGFAFKVSLVPFHAWTPDVYQGAPTPITALMGSVGKVAAFAALLRVFTVALPGRSDDWGPAVLVLAIATLFIGSVLAVIQTDVKRMLAYSSISHAGFILVGLEASSHVSNPDSTLGVSSAMAYLFVYGILVVGTLAVVAIIAGKGDADTSLSSFNGLGKTNPLLALGMTTLLLAQAGVPLTSGFVAKFGIIRTAVSVESYALAVIAMLAAVIAAFLYLRIMVSMWLSEPATAERRVIPKATGVTIAASVAVTLVIGFIPTLLLDVANLIQK
jgi:NADH-quinone oxidoreductase subunit N